MTTWNPELLKPLAGRDFRRVWLGETASVVGGGIQLVVLVALVLEISGSGVALGLMFLFSGLPRAALMIIGGVLTDRISPRLVMLASYACRGIVIGVLALLSWAGQLQVWHIFAGRFMFGLADAVFWPAVTAIVVRTVDRHELVQANSLHRTVLSVGTVGGPGLAGLLLVFIGSTLSLALAAICYSFALLLLLPVRERPLETEADGRTDEAGFVASAMAGFRYTLRTPGTRWTLGLLILLNLALIGPVNVGMPALAAIEFSEPALIGGFFAALGVGSVLGSVLAGLTGSPQRPGIWLCTLGAANGAAVVLFGVSEQVWLALVACALIGMTAAIVNVVALLVIQVTTSTKFLGRVMSWYMLSEFGMAPLSSVLVGVMVDVSITMMFVITGGFAVAVAVAAMAAPPLRELSGEPHVETAPAS